MRKLTTLALAVSLLSFACSKEKEAVVPAKLPAPKPQPAAEARVETMPAPSGTGAAEPFLFADGHGLLLSWLEPAGKNAALRFSRFENGAWSQPRTVVQSGSLFVNWADFPSVVQDAGGVLYAHWLQKSGKGSYAYDVRMSTSTDGGVSWREPFLLNRDGKEAEHGFVSMVPLPGGGVGTAWLDGRNMTGGHHGHEGGDMTLRYAKVSAGGEIIGETELDGRTCECCTTGMTMTEAGPVLVYRDRSAEEIRDIGVVRGKADGWTEPVLLANDGWKIAGCPVNGPQIDASGKRVAAAWFTSASGTPRVKLAVSADSGASFGAPVVIDDGKPVGRVDVVVLDDGSAVTGWLEQTPQGAEVRARRIGPGGERGASLKIGGSSATRSAGFVRMARVGSEIWFAWNTSEPVKGVSLARLRF